VLDSIESRSIGIGIRIRFNRLGRRAWSRGSGPSPRFPLYLKESEH